MVGSIKGSFVSGFGKIRLGSVLLDRHVAFFLGLLWWLFVDES